MGSSNSLLKQNEVGGEVGGSSLLVTSDGGLPGTLFEGDLPVTASEGSFLDDKGLLLGWPETQVLPDNGGLLLPETVSEGGSLDDGGLPFGLRNALFEEGLPNDRGLPLNLPGPKGVCQ